MNRFRRMAIALAAALAAVLVAPLTAHAVGYQFWGYYQVVDDEWAFAVEGVATTVPDDGTVQGLRFAVSAGEDVRPPRDMLQFDEVCADVSAENDHKRVALVIDPGRDVDAPQGEPPPAPGAQCVVAEPDATTLEVISLAVPDVRTENDMLCGLAGFPASVCSEEVAEPTPEQLAADEAIEIPVVPVGEPILTPPTDEPTQEPTPDPTEEPTTDEPTTEPTEGTDEETTPAEEETTQDGATEETTQEATETTEETTDGEVTQAPPSETPDEATADEDSSDGIPPWAWAVGILVLLGILAFVATSARNRRLDAAQQDPYADGPGADSDDPYAGRPADEGPEGPRDRPPGGGDGR